MPSLQENKRRSNKDLAVVRPRVSPYVGRLWDGAVTLRTSKSASIIPAISGRSLSETMDSIVQGPIREYYPRIGERNASGIAALGS